MQTLMLLTVFTQSDAKIKTAAYSGFFLGLWGVVVGAVCWVAILWASLVMKRHTFKEFLLGTLTCLVSFTTAWLIFH